MTTQVITRHYQDYHDRLPNSNEAINSFSIEVARLFVDKTTICGRCAGDAICNMAAIMAKGGIRSYYHCPECGDEFVIEKDQSKIDYLIQGATGPTP